MLSKNGMTNLELGLHLSNTSKIDRLHLDITLNLYVQKYKLRLSTFI